MLVQQKLLFYYTYFIIIFKLNLIKSNFLVLKVAIIGDLMNKNGFLKECIADSLIKLMEHTDFTKITIADITKGAGVNRSTWFRNFSTKNECLTYKLIMLWERWSAEHNIIKTANYSFDNAKDFLFFCYDIKDILTAIYKSNVFSVTYDAFNSILRAQFESTEKMFYENRFYLNGMFGLLEEWTKRDFFEKPEQMNDIFYELISNFVESNS